MFGLRDRGSLNKTMRYLDRLQKSNFDLNLDQYGRMGVDALSSATPRDTSETASSWGYVVRKSKSVSTITWFNDNVNNGVNIAIILQYGHGTGTGGWVEGYDYINPAIRPIFDKFVDDIRKKVKP